ncbi:nickel-binding protein [Geminicoccus roseus]|uniref:nickel-binding protein n=1 Tax=Geminicoccus roseus TaxID=404900 RepID=UPI00041CC0F0|nr:nickel-binding protein [Geminicoccus roseus]
MPIFMDRHDFNGTTAEAAAEAHRQDIAIQDRYGVKFLTYWFDEARGTVFCLVDAPDRETVTRVHQDSHGGIPNVLVEVELSAVEAFLGRIADPAPPAPDQPVDLEPAFRTVMFTDIVGSTEMTARLGDRFAVEIVRAHDALVRRALGRHQGREVKHTGDGIMASFFEVDAAIACACEIQRSFAAFNRSSAQPIQVRIGLHAGEPIEDSRDLFGTTVQMAARICGAAEAGAIVASAEVRQACQNHGGWIELGPSQLKGFPLAVPLFQVQDRAGDAG